MKRSSGLLCGLLMSCLAFRGSCEEVFVDQSPSNITVKEGESAEISCCWSKTTNFNLKASWYKYEERIPPEKQENRMFSMKNCSTLKLTNVDQNYTGVYVCKVIQDIPELKTYTGKNTTLNVTEVQPCTTQTTTKVNRSTTSAQISTTKKTDPLPIMPLSLAASIVVVTLCLAFSVWKMRNICKKSDRVVIHQTPHSDGEEHEHTEEEEGSTGSSRGSLQWYQVPVYWSYFDLQRGEEQ